MKKYRSLFYPILMFVLAQLAWFLVVGLWIYRYVSSKMIFRQVGESLSPQLVAKITNVLPLIGGLILMVSVSIAMSLIFRHLTIQWKITNMYDNFIANVTHELKSPLSSIQLYLETLNSRNVKSTNQREFIGFMLKDTERLQNLINSILDISGLEQKKFVYSFQVVTAGPTFRQLIEEVVSQFKLPDESVTISGDAPCRCVIDQDGVCMVLSNLVDNAIKYSTSPPKIDFALSCTARHVHIEMKDYGIGMYPKDQKKVFHKFMRIYRKDIPNVKGTGLGLYWVKEIIIAHGGKIMARSEGLGKGSTFLIELPIYKTTKKRYIDKLLKITRKRKKDQGVDNGSE